MLSKQSFSILSVLLAELQGYANTGHCSQAGVCASAYMYGRIINTVNLPKTHIKYKQHFIARIITTESFPPKTKY